MSAGVKVQLTDEINSLPESIEKALEVQNKIKESIAPIMESQERIEIITAPLSRAFSAYKTNILFSSPMIEAMKQSVIHSAFENIKLQLSVPALNLAKQINISLRNSLTDSIRGVLDNYTSIVNVLRTPALDWFRSFDFTPITEALKNLQIDSDISRKYRELNEIYLQTMYETKWFPYAGWIADMSLFREVNEIISTSKGVSKNREKRIDKAILSYYTKTEIRGIKRLWWNTDLHFCIRKTLSQAIEAYLRGEYALTISCLSTMWEGLIYIKAKDVPPSERKRQRMDTTKQELQKLVEYNDYELIFSDYFNNFIVSNCNAVDDVVEGVPNRHGVAHSWYKKYPNKKAALNAVLLTDFIINLKPIEQTEESKEKQFQNIDC